jgi:hypothetical protein
MTGTEAEKLLEETAAKLGEHFDAIQILGTWSEDGLTKCSKRGVGNWYARQGMAHEFINADLAQENAREIAEQLNPPDDEWKVT